MVLINIAIVKSSISGTHTRLQYDGYNMNCKKT